MQNYKYEECIQENKKQFEELLDIVNNKALNFDYRLETALIALRFAVFSPTGYFYCNDLEKFFIDIAQENDISSYNIPHQKGTILHVLTTAYTSGGHTRVVERWIKNHTGFKHSVVLLNQNKSEIPQTLINNCKDSGGEMFVFSEDNLIQRSLKLRELALRYEYVVLHIHMDDPAATIAFGTEKFTRPVLLFNHADHLFWIGKYIADVVLNFRTKSSISNKYRLITNNKKLPIPVDNSNDIKSETSAMRNEHPIIFSSGSSFKYSPFENKSLIPVFDEILTKSPSSLLYVVGVKTNGMWKPLVKKYKKRVTLIERLPYPEYLQKLRTASVVVDSYPVSGGTAIIDAIKQNIPFVSLKTIEGQTDFVENSNGICNTPQELVDKVIKILEDKTAAKELLLNELNKFNEENDIDLWVKNIKNILSATPEKHQLQEFTEQKIFINDYTMMIYWMYKKEAAGLLAKKILFIPHILTFEKYKIGNQKIKRLKLFNKTVFKSVKQRKKKVK